MLTGPMHAMLAVFAAGHSAIHAMHGRKNADRTLGALLTRGLIRFVPIGNDPRYGNVVITPAGAETAFRYLLTGGAAPCER